MSILKKTNTGMKNPIDINWIWADRKFTTYVKKITVRGSRENTSFEIDLNEISAYSNNSVTLRVCLDDNLKDFVHYILSKDFDICHIRLEGQMQDNGSIIYFHGLRPTWFDEKKGFVCLVNTNREVKDVTQEYYEHAIQEIMLVPAEKINVNN